MIKSTLFQKAFIYLARVGEETYRIEDEVHEGLKNY